MPRAVWLTVGKPSASFLMTRNTRGMLLSWRAPSRPVSSYQQLLARMKREIRLEACGNVAGLSFEVSPVKDLRLQRVSACQRESSVVGCGRRTQAPCRSSRAVEIGSPTTASAIEVIFPRGQPLGVRAGFDPATLAQLLAVLEELQPG